LPSRTSADGEKIPTDFFEESVKKERAMKLAVVNSFSGGSLIGGGKTPTMTSFREFRILARFQPPTVTARMTRLSRGVERAIERSDPKRFERARWLEEAVAYIAQSRPEHAESQALQQCLTRLLRQSFRSLDWRRALIAGLAPVETRIPPRERAVSRVKS
jgi:hypothetical protein